MTIYKATDINEAVEMAKSFHAEGQYDWFRGQVSNWPLKSSFSRRSKEQREVDMEKLARFHNWVKNTDGLQGLVKHPDSQIAVAQHYGLPTNFIDFTTNPEIAAFFATEGHPHEEMPSCIMCLDTNDLKAFWNHMPSKFPPPEFLELEVDNLWRLEAQFGVFLFCPYENFEHIYDLDRIIFPYTKPYRKISRHYVYPSRKSALEILLDQYFMNEALIEGTKAVRLMNIHTCVIDEFPNNCDPDLISGKIDIHESWESNQMSYWVESKKESYFSSVTSEFFEIDLTARTEDNSVADWVSSILLGKLSEDTSIRNSLISWKIILPANFQKDMNYRIDDVISRLWDGLRGLPCSKEDIARSIGNCVALFFHRLDVTPKSRDIWLDTASLCLGKCIEVEFGADDGSYSRGYVNSNNLLQTVRNDINMYVAPKYKEKLQDNIVGLLQAVQSPRRLFDFDKFKSLFVQEIVPAQVILRSHAIFYSPARLTLFGLS